MPIRDLKTQIARLPEQPGVYLYYNGAGETLYVGKARILRYRVRSYLGAHGMSPRLDALLDEAQRLEVIVTDSVVEALALENHLIKQRTPKYNILLRDDKNYPYLQLTMGEAYPRVLVARRVERDGHYYAGPFLPASLARKTMSLTHRLFGMRSCNETITGERGRPCLEFDIKRCIAPCVRELCTAEEYRAAVEHTKLFLEGRNDELVAGLRARMTEAATAERFEQAAQLRDAIRTIETLRTRQQKMASAELGDRDAFGLKLGAAGAVVQVFQVRGGRVVERVELVTEADVRLKPGATDEGGSVRPQADVTEADVRLKPGATDEGGSVRLQADMTEADVRLKPDATNEGGNVRRQADVTEADVRLKPDATDEGGNVRRQADVTEADVRLKPGATDEGGSVRLQADLTEGEIIQAALQQFYEDRPAPPEIHLPVALPEQEAEIIEGWLSALAERRVRLVVPKRGEKRGLLDLAARNAEVAYQTRFNENVAANYDALETLRAVLALPAVPRRIECFDISTIQGSETVASMVVCEDGRMKKSEYRKFRIRGSWFVDRGSKEQQPLSEELPTTAESPQTHEPRTANYEPRTTNHEPRLHNDFIAMQEVVMRRYRKLLETGGPFPDLVLIDGGKGQLSAAYAALEELGLGSLVAAGIAKKEELLFTRDHEDAIALPHDSPALLLIQRIRDEAHRFAVTFHRQSRTKRDLRSEIDAIAGVGPRRRKALLTAFGSLAGVRRATREELMKVVGAKCADAVLAHFASQA